MFEVKGWSISADKLKFETADVKTTTTDGASQSAVSPGPSQNKKRKRPGNSRGLPDVNDSNFAELWEKVIEKKEIPSEGEKPPSRKERKLAKQAQKKQPVEDKGPRESDVKPEHQQKQSGTQQEKESKTEKKKSKQDTSPAPVAVAAEEEGEEWSGFNDDDGEAEKGPKPAQATITEEPGKSRKRKKQKIDKDTRPAAEEQQSITAKPATQPTPPPPTAVKLTPLQASMREKLVSARFRHLNEALYTRPSADAFQLFADSPEMFSEYHEGFRRQVDVWPENPVEGFISDIESRAKVRFPPKNVRHDFSNPISNIRLLPLPRTSRFSNTCTIADLGCGDAALASRLQPKLSKLRIDIRSFDLQTGGSQLITRADIANLPLADNSVDIAIFCLALMGTNWLDFIEEAYRILRWKGELWIAEIKSRFTNPRAAKGRKVVTHSVGNRRNPIPAPGTIEAAAAATSKKSKKQREAAEAAAEAAEAELAVQVDGVELRRQETDVTAFVDALRARGFLLHKELGGGAVDMDNKMFVRMYFAKAAPATKGKCAEKPKPNMDRMGATGPARKGKFITDDEDDVDEAAILKPCVYKQR